MQLKRYKIIFLISQNILSYKVTFDYPLHSHTNPYASTYIEHDPNVIPFVTPTHLHFIRCVGELGLKNQSCSLRLFLSYSELQNKPAVLLAPRNLFREEKRK